MPLLALPSEIIDEILGSLCSDDDGHSTIQDRSSLESPRPPTPSRVNNLKRLRLVSKLMCHYASPHLFRSFSIKLSYFADGRFSAYQWRERLTRFGCSGFAEHVRVLFFSIVDSHLGNMEEPEPLPSTELTGLSEVISALTRACVQLRAIQILVGSVAFGTIIVDLGESRKFVFTMIASILRACPSCLSSLDLRVGFIWDIEDVYLRLAKTPASCCALSNLTSLRLEAHHRGEGGVFRNFEACDDREYRVEISTNVWNLAALVLSPKYFCVNGGGDLVLDELSAGVHSNLEQLRLSKLSSTHNKFLELISLNNAALGSVDLTLVALRSGTWERVFQALCKCSCLLNLQIRHCGYRQPRDSEEFGPSPQKRAQRGEYGQPLYTNRPADWHAFEAAQKHINALRTAAGLSISRHATFGLLKHVISTWDRQGLHRFNFT